MTQLDPTLAERVGALELAVVALGRVELKDFSQKTRAKLADKGQAMPGGGFPIENTADLGRAIQAFGRASDPEATKAWIKKRARALGAEDQLPDSWK